MALTATSIKIIRENTDPSNKRLKIEGWVKVLKKQKIGTEIHVSDGTTVAPLRVFAPKTLKNYRDAVCHLSLDCGVCIEGKLDPLITGRSKRPLLLTQKIRVLSRVLQPRTYPLAKRLSKAQLQHLPHLRIRLPLYAEIARMRDAAAYAIHRFFHEHGFYWVHTPILTSSDWFWPGNMLRVSALNLEDPPKDQKGNIDFSQDLFETPAYLTISAQAHAEVYAHALSKVYTFGPAFRKEYEASPRHLIEFWLVEANMAFTNLEELQTVIQSLLQFIARELLNTCEEEVAFLSKKRGNPALSRLKILEETKIATMEYGEAIRILKKERARFKTPIKWGMELNAEHERYLADRYVKQPLMILNFPRMIREFDARLNKDKKTVASLDVLVPGIGEILGGSQQEERFQLLQKSLASHPELPTTTSQWCRDLMRYGSIAHSGFALGFDRWVAYLTGVDNVSLVHPFPRNSTHFEC